MLKFLIKGALALGAAGLVLEGIKKLTENAPAQMDKEASADDADAAMPADTVSPAAEDEKTETDAAVPFAPAQVKTSVEALTINSTREGENPDGLTINTVERPGAPEDCAKKK